MICNKNIILEVFNIPRYKLSLEWDGQGQGMLADSLSQQHKITDKSRLNATL